MVRHWRIWVAVLFVAVAVGGALALFWPRPVEPTGEPWRDRALAFEHDIAQAQATTIIGAIAIGAVLLALVAVTLMRGRGGESKPRGAGAEADFPGSPSRADEP